MKATKILIVLAILIPTFVYARGALVPIVPTANISIGGNQSAAVLTGSKIPVVKWKSTNGASFKSYFTVNNSKACGGITNNQAWGQAKSAAGSFDFGSAPQAREGCVLTITYEVTSRTGHKAVDRATIRYTKPAVINMDTSTDLKLPTNTSTTTQNRNIDIKFTSVGGGDKLSGGETIVINWESKGLTNNNELHLYLDRVDGAPLKGSAERLSFDAKSHNFKIPVGARSGEYFIVIAVTENGADSLINAKTFKSKPFTVYGDQTNELANVSFTVLDTRAKVVDEGKDKGVFEVDLLVKSDKDIVIDEDLTSDINWWNTRNIGGFVSLIGYGYGDNSVGSKGVSDFSIVSDGEVIPAGKAESKKFIVRKDQDVKFTITMSYIPDFSDSYLMELAGFKYKLLSGLEYKIVRLSGRTPSVFVPVSGDNATSTVALSADFTDQGSVSNNDEGSSRDYTFELDITPSRGIFLPDFASSSPIRYKVEGAGTVRSTISVDIAAAPIILGDGRLYYYIPANESRKITGTVTVDNATTTGQYRIVVEGINYTLNYTESPNSSFYKFDDTSKFRTAYRTINSSSFSQSFFQKFVKSLNPINSLSAMGVGVLKLMGLW